MAAPGPASPAPHTTSRSAKRALLGLATLAPVAYGVTTLALAQINGLLPDWYMEGPKLAMLGLCSLHLYRSGLGMEDRLEHALAKQASARALAARLVPEQRRLTRELARARSDARTKNAFLARMGHYLRTPMNGILATTELALAGDLSPEQRDLLATARESGRALLTAVDHVLDSARIEAGELTLNPLPTELQAVVAGALSRHAGRAHAQHAELVCHIDADLPARIVADPERLEQVLDLLLARALSAAGRGTVVLSLEREHEQLCVTVSDTGTGLTPEQVEHMLEPWADLGDRERGVLGPAVAAQLVELMGARLRLHSELGLGTRATFELSLENLPDEQPTDSAPDLRGVSLLVAEGRMTSRTILASTLSQWGARVVSVENGTQAIDALEEARAAGRAHHVVLLDEDLPDRECFERDQGGLSSEHDGQVVLLCSGDTPSPGNTPRHTLRRPLLNQDIARVLLCVLRGDAPDGDQALANLRREAMGRPLRVLVVEDNPVGQKVAQRVLSAWGHTVWIAGDGKQALSMLDRQPVDLVLMDLAMPVMDGLAATRSLREAERREGRPRLPVIAMTAHADRGDRERCLAAGMDAHVAKPLRAEELAAVIAELRQTTLTH